jgi:hemolysin activation/secretion protein
VRALIIFLSISTWISLGAVPPPVPSGGVIERQIEKEYEAEPLEIEKKNPDIQIDIPEEQLTIPSGAKIHVCKVEVRGNESLPLKEIEARIEPQINCPLSISDIHRLCRTIEALYSEKDFFLARVFPPPQEIKDGTLILEVLEGKLGNVTVDGNKHYSDSFVLKYFTHLLNRSLNYRSFLRALLLLNENSDLAAGAIFEKGHQIGEADVIIHVIDKYPIHLYLNGNDYGRYLTTNFRAGGRLDTQIFVDGDKLSVAEVVGFPIDALYFTDVVYRVPINARGTFCEISYLNSRFHVQEMLYLRLAGRSDIGSLKISHALHRGRLLSCDLFANFDYKQIQNFTLSQTTSFDKIRLLTLGSTLDYFSQSAGRNYIVMKMGMGIPGLFDGLSHPTALSSRPGAQGNFFKLNVDYDYLKKLKYDSFFVFHLTGQWSPNLLTVPEQIYIGGADTIRGFPLATALGDSGYYFNLEFRVPPLGFANSMFLRTQKKWKDVLQFSLFLDQGGVFYKGGSDVFECGAGLGMRIMGFWSLAFSAEVGFPLTHRDLSKDAFFYFKITGQPF